MILSDHSIREALDSGKISIDPFPNGTQIQPASLDVRLGDEIVAVESGRSLTSHETHLAPNRRYLAHTRERIELPNDVAAQLAGRSTVGRKGVIVHKTAGWIDPGFTGTVTLEMMNLGQSPVKLERGERIAQLVFFRLDNPSTGYDGKYQNQEGPTGAR
jgi:dCTP deaminase